MHAAMAVTSPSAPYAYNCRLHQTLEASCSSSASASASAPTLSLSRCTLSPKVQLFFRSLDCIYYCVAYFDFFGGGIVVLSWLFCRSRASSALGFRFPVDSIRRFHPHHISCGVARTQILGQVSLGFVFVV